MPCTRSASSLVQTKADKIIRIPHDSPFANEMAPVVICDPDGLFHLHAVQGNVGQQGRHDAALRGSLLRCMKHFLFDVACFEPLLDELLSRGRADGLEQSTRARYGRKETK